MIVRKSVLAALLSICLPASLLALASGSAQALVTHRYLPGALPQLGQGVPVEGPHGEKVLAPGPLSFAGSMTIDSGHLWIAEQSGTVNGEGTFRVGEFDATTGAFISQLAQSQSAPRYGEWGIAIGHATGETVTYVGESLDERGNEPAVAVFDEAGAQKTWTGAGTPAGSFGSLQAGANANHVTVDNSSNPLDEYQGDVFVASHRQGVIDVFRPEAGNGEHYVGQIDAGRIQGLPAGESFEPSEIAISEVNGDLIVLNHEVYDILEPAALGQYVLVGAIAATPSGPLAPLNLAVDGNTGEIYVLANAGPGAVVDQYSAAGSYLGRIAGEDAPNGEISQALSLVVSQQSDVYVGNIGGRFGTAMYAFGPDVVRPDVTTGPALAVTRSGATLNGTVNPDNAGAATCRFEWGTSQFFGEVASCEPEAVAQGASPVSVHSALGKLQPDTTYYYRLQATNQNGTNPGEAFQDVEFTTPGPGIHHESVSAVAATSVTFNATIDPHGVPATYYFQYGTTTAYGTDVPSPPGQAIGSGEGDVEVPAYHVQGLEGGTLYHYRVVVTSEVKPGQFEVFEGPDETFTTETAMVSTLPDGRQWEMVSPPDKKGAGIGGLEESGLLQAAADGDAIAYLSNAPIEAEPPGNSNAPQVLSTRGTGGWQSRDILPPRDRVSGTTLSAGQEYRLFAEDLKTAIVQPFGYFEPSLSSEASEQGPYLHTLDESCGSSCYRPLVTGKPGDADVSPGTVIDSTGCGVICGPEFLGATPDLSHVLLASSAPLVEGAGEGGALGELYEWTAGKLALVSVLPGGEPSNQGGLLGEADISTRRAISSDGSRVVWQVPRNVSGEGLYMRDLLAGKTIRLDEAEPSCVANGGCASGEAKFQIASVDGSRVFFTSTHALTINAGNGNAGSELYQCEISVTAGEPECRLSDLTPARIGETIAVQGAVLGASEDGSYVYFVANGVLAEKAIPGSCQGFGSKEGECNLYVRHDGVTKLITVLSAADSEDWSETPRGMPVRVSSNGRWLTFMSHASLTGYDNRDAVSGRPDAEVYLYDASTGRLVCASCNPTGARPSGALAESLAGWVAASVPGWLDYSGVDAIYQPRYLDDSGRLFFDSSDALVPQDVNGVEDVYEYEPPGVGNCSATSTTFDERSAGCVGMISAGTSPEPSEFQDASTGGGDVFFRTASRLALQDYDASNDIYDAHECTASSPCFPAEVAQPPACETAEACRSAPAPQPAIFGSPSSATFSGAGNVTPEALGGAVTKKSLSRAQKLSRALRACRKRDKSHKRVRASCERRARTLYAPPVRRDASKKASSKKGKR